MRLLPLRLRPGDDLRAALEAAVAREGLGAAYVLSGIGSLSATRIRFAGIDTASSIDGDIELLTLAGSIAANGSHLHATVADAQGVVRGGHVAAGCIVRTTAEVLIALLPEWRLVRQLDAATGYDELSIRPNDAGAGAGA